MQFKTANAHGVEQAFSPAAKLLKKSALAAEAMLYLCHPDRSRATKERGRVEGPDTVSALLAVSGSSHQDHLLFGFIFKLAVFELKDEHALSRPDPSAGGA